MNWKFWARPQKQEPNYEVIELQAENDKLKDDLIDNLKSRIKELENQLALFSTNLLTDVRDPYENDKVTIKPRPRLSTMSDIARALEVKSLTKREKTDEVQNSK